MCPRTVDPIDPRSVRPEMSASDTLKCAGATCLQQVITRRDIDELEPAIRLWRRLHGGRRHRARPVAGDQQEPAAIRLAAGIERRAGDFRDATRHQPKLDRGVVAAWQW